LALTLIQYNSSKQMKQIVSFIAFLLITTGSMAQSTADLKLKLEKNKTYRLVSASEQTTSQTMNGIQQNVESKTRYAVSLKMMEATADFMITEVRFDTVDIRTNAMGKNTVINSAGEGNVTSSETSDVMTYFMNRFCKNGLYVKMDFTGKVQEIVNSKMFSAIALKDTGSITLTGPVAAAVKMQIVNMFGDNALKTMIEMFTWNLPGKAVSTGENWEIIQKLNTGGMMLDILTKNHLDGLKENTALVTSESEISAANNAEPIKQGGATITYDDLKGMSKANLVIDIATGLPKENNGKSRISGNLGVSAPGLSMQIPLEISGETKVMTLP
jgi:hypothetical protein